MLKKLNDMVGSVGREKWVKFVTVMSKGEFEVGKVSKGHQYAIRKI